jgi:hypothetical protein
VRRRFRIRCFCFVSGALLATSTACDSGDRNSDFVVSDSAGVEIVLNRAQARELALDTQPALRIGSTEGDSFYQLYRVTAVRSLPGGRIVVANGETHDLRFYDSVGIYISRTGREGAGPGEFRAIDRVEIVQDSIWVSDPRLRRVSVLSLHGKFVRSINLSASPGLVLPRLRGIFDNGGLLVEVIALGNDEAVGIQSIHSRFYHANREGLVVDTLGDFESGQHLIQASERGSSSVRLPFARASAAAAAGSEFYYGSAEHYQVSRFSLDGRLERIIRRAGETRPVRSEDLGQYIESIATLNPDPAARQRFTDMYRNSPLPQTMPAFLSFRTDSDKRLWVEEYRMPNDSFPEWSLFDGEGRYRGTLRLPARFILHEIGPDFVLGVRQDNSDVEYVERYRMPRLNTP